VSRDTLLVLDPLHIKSVKSSMLLVIT